MRECIWNSKKSRSYFILAFAWMCVIFYLSHQPAADSDTLSIGLTERLIQFLEDIVPISEASFKELHHFVRKNAHFVAYLLLGIFTVFALGKNKIKNEGSIAFVIGTLYAAGDEYHQLFVAGRSGQISDVILDSAGVLCGILLYKLIKKIFKREDKRVW